MAAGFNSPSILFLSTWDKPERDYMHALSRKVRQAGYTRVVEPCAGAFALPAVHVAAGWEPSQVETSDVWLYTAIVGAAIQGRDLAELDVRVDGQLIPLEGDPVRDAATLLFVQMRLRIDNAPDHPYWSELRRDLAYREAKHIDALRRGVEGYVERLAGMSFTPSDPWTHLDAVVDDPHTVVTMNPPTYKGAYEKFFSTDNRLTWAEPRYDVWDPGPDQAKLADRYQDAKALLLIQQQQQPGQASGDVVHARDLSRDQVVYIWSNRGDEVRALMGHSAVGRGGAIQKLDWPILPADYEVREDSVIGVERIGSGEARYYKDLWVHKLDSKGAGVDFALLVDGHIAGIAGLDARPIFMPYEHGRKGTVILTYATACPHRLRLTRLVTAVALSWPALRACLDAWTLIRVQEMVTVELTHHPEIKGLRGLMKLEERVPDKTYGNRLVYVAEPKDQPLERTLADWIEKERTYQAKRGVTV